MTPLARSASPKHTGLAPLGLGTAALGNLFQARSQDDAFDVLGAAMNHGIDFIDTAPFYGHGLAEERIGQFLRQTDYTPHISTKVGRVLDPLRQGETLPDHGFVNPNRLVPRFDYSAAGFEASLKGSMRRLGRDYIDVVLVHDLGELTHGAAHQGHLQDALNGGFPRLAALKAARTIGAIGVGVNEIAIIETVLQHMDIDVILLAGRHTLLDQSALDSRIFEACAARGIKVILGGVFNSGLLVTPDAAEATFDYGVPTQEIKERARLLAQKCAQAGLALPAAALAYARATQHIDRVLVGPGNLQEWQSLQAWSQTHVPDALLAQLSDIAALS
jgi:D-threo-aldose 1-dehydrogenase